MRLFSTRLFLFTVIGLLSCCFETACHRSTGLKARLVRAEKASVEAERLLDQAEAALRAVEPARAEEALRKAESKLNEPDVDYYPERESIRTRRQQLQGQLAASWADLRRRELDSKVADQQLSLEQPLIQWRESLKGLGTRELTEETLDRARDTTEALQERLKQGQSLEPQHLGYAKQAETIRLSLQKESPRLEVATKTIAFIKGPGQTRNEAQDLWQRARTQKDRKRRHELLDEVRGKFWACGADGREMLAATPLLAKTTLLFDGQVTSPSAITKGCESRVQSLDKSLAALNREEQRERARQAKQSRKAKSPKR
jgi:hypothetical protein